MEGTYTSPCCNLRIEPKAIQEEINGEQTEGNVAAVTGETVTYM